MRAPLIALPVASELVAGAHRFAMNAPYVHAIQRAGGLPILLPVCGPCDLLVKKLGEFDGLLLTGGDDIAPEFYGQDETPFAKGIDRVRDMSEIELARLALDKGLPLLGICRGVQLLNVAAGGTLHQDILAARPGALDHRYQPGRSRSHLAHQVRLQRGSQLARFLRADGPERVEVNSMHHQAVDSPPPSFRVVAWAPDDIIEAIEMTNHHGQFAVGVQWHPEELVPQHPQMVSLFQSFVAACRERPGYG